jgi:hypothetical protein
MDPDLEKLTKFINDLYNSESNIKLSHHELLTKCMNEFDNIDIEEKLSKLFEQIPENLIPQESIKKFMALKNVNELSKNETIKDVIEFTTNEQNIEKTVSILNICFSCFKMKEKN